MTEASTAVSESATPPAGPSAGELLRQAREAQGMHIAALAVAVKVQQRKLEALEGDRLDELPDITFARALAQTVCRHLHTDAKPILERMPQSGYGQRLEAVAMGLNEPFKGNGILAPLGRGDWTVLARPSIIATALLMLAALAVYLWPSSPAPDPAVTADRAPVAATTATTTQPTPETVRSDTVAAPATVSPPPPAAAASPVVDTVYSAPPSLAGSSATAADAANRPAGLVVVRTSEESWMEIRDASGQVLLSRLVTAGEAIGLDGQPPFKLKLGNASAVQVAYRGEPVDLAPWVRDNVARFTLK